MSDEKPIFFERRHVARCNEGFHVFGFEAVIGSTSGGNSLIAINKSSEVAEINTIVEGCELSRVPRLVGILYNSVDFINAEPRIRGCIVTCAPTVVTALLVPTKVADRTDVECGSRSELLRTSSSISCACVRGILPNGVECGLGCLGEFSLVGSVELYVRAILTMVR